jgi:leucyl-tRNA synthetase
MKYNNKEIEKKWQQYWEETQMFATEANSSKKKYYILDMFPYPSGAGLHVGHPEGYTATDIIAKYKKMNGYNVLHPMGWDSFGLPAENYAIKTGTPPQESTDGNIKNFTRQIKSIGFGYDWSREVTTSSPEYYRWTQWLFQFLYKHKLAEKRQAPVNWCESCMTVLANEQVLNGHCERCDSLVIQKKLHQWFFKTTSFADQLVDDLSALDWPESLKSIQENWIGRSHGAQITFEVQDTEEYINVYTTRPDTLFGVTYMVLAPEHPLLEKLEAKIENIREVKEYQLLTQQKSELERTDLNKTKSGIQLRGITALHPLTQESLPVFISDYVLTSYGTGAIMAVPAHDQRDYEFAQKYNLPVHQVLEGGDISQEAHTGEGVMVNSDFLNGQPSQDAIRHMIEHLEEKGIGYGKVQYKLRDWLVSRQRYWGAPIPVVYDNRDEAYLVPESELPVVLPTDVDFRPTGESPLVHSVSFNNTQDLKRIEDALRASGELPEDRTIVRREYDTMDTFVCSSWYFLRYADPHNAEAFASPESMKEWLPVDLYVGGVEHAVLHLLYARFVVKALHAQGLVEFSEPFVRVRNQGLILAEGGEKMSKSKGNVVNPDEVVQAHSADTLRMYLMFMGPFEDSKPWNTKGIQGVNRFLDRVYMNREKIGADTPEIETLLHQTIKKVTDDIEVLSFNTAISQMMILNNAIADQGCSQETYAMFVQILAPFAPHLAEELWSELGNTTSVFVSEWPQYDPNKAVALTKEIGVQVNGKVRGSIMVTIDDSQEEVEKKALADKNVQAHIEGKDIKKVIYVEGRIVNIIV